MTWDGRDRRKDMTFTQEEKTRLFTELGEIRQILTGGSRPQDGLMFRVAQHGDFIIFWQKFGWLVLAGFSGVPCTVIAGIVLYLVKGGANG